MTPAALHHLTISPRSSTLVAGSSQSYLVSAYDAYGNFRAKVAAVLTIDGGGACSGLTCTPPSSPGQYTVTASFDGQSVTGTLRVTAAADR